MQRARPNWAGRRQRSGCRRSACSLGFSNATDPDGADFIFTQVELLFPRSLAGRERRAGRGRIKQKQSGGGGGGPLPQQVEKNNRISIQLQQARRDPAPREQRERCTTHSSILDRVKPPPHQGHSPEFANFETHNMIYIYSN